MSMIRVLPAAKTYATGVLTLAGNAVAAETVTLGDRVYTWRAAVSLPNEVLVGANAAASIVNLVAAINKGTGEGTLYGTGTSLHPLARAADGAGDTIDITALVDGIPGQIATTETMTNASFAATTLLMAGTDTSAAPTIGDGTLGVELPHADQAVVLVQTTAGSGVITVTLRIWGWHRVLGRWFDLGQLNGGVAIPESAIADQISYAEGVTGLRVFSRVHFQIVAFAGTTPKFAVHLQCLPFDTATVG